MGLKTSNIVQDVYTNNYIDTIRDAINDCYEDDPTTKVNSLQKVLEGLGVTIDWTKLGYSN